MTSDDASQPTADGPQVSYYPTPADGYIVAITFTHGKRTLTVVSGEAEGIGSGVVVEHLFNFAKMQQVGNLPKEVAERQILETFPEATDIKIAWLAAHTIDPSTGRPA